MGSTATIGAAVWGGACGGPRHCCIRWGSTSCKGKGTFCPLHLSWSPLSDCQTSHRDKSHVVSDTVVCTSLRSALSELVDEEAFYGHARALHTCHCAALQHAEHTMYSHRTRCDVCHVTVGTGVVLASFHHNSVISHNHREFTRRAKRHSSSCGSTATS